MDSELWIPRLAAAKRHFSLQHQHASESDRLSIDDFEGVEEGRTDFPCPNCYEDHDIPSLCSHLEDEHPFESGVAVCPVCAVKVTRDMMNHIKMQHGHLFKMQRRRRLHRVAIPSSQALSLLGRDLREAHLQVLLGREEAKSSTTEDSSNKKATPSKTWKSSLDSSLSYEEREKKRKQISIRANFMQDLLLSTLFAD